MAKSALLVNHAPIAGRDDAAMRTVVFFAYLFPPIGGGGVQRSLKFVKYLPRTGWRPIVVTVRAISYYVYDPGLLDEVPESVEVVRTQSLDPLRLSALLFPEVSKSKKHGPTRHPVFSESGRWIPVYRAIRKMLFFPDGQLGWIPFVFWAGLRAIKTNHSRVIYSPATPYSSAVAALLLSKWTRIPYVVDFRDGWTDDSYNIPPTRLHRHAHRFLERLVVTNASAICVYGNWLRERFAERYPGISAKITEITNGFDPADLENADQIVRPDGIWRLVYSGSLFPHHREAFRTVLAAIRIVLEAQAGKAEVIVVGQFYPEASADIVDAGLGDVVQLKGYVPHSTALGYLLSANASLLLVRKGDVASVTGKVFELLMVGRPIVALADSSGECARVLRMAGADTHLHSPDDEAGVAESIAKLISHPDAKTDPARSAQFSRIVQTEQLAGILDEVERAGRNAVHNPSSPPRSRFARRGSSEKQKRDA